MTPNDLDTALVCLLAADLAGEPEPKPALLTPEQARAHARERAAHVVCVEHGAGCTVAGCRAERRVFPHSHDPTTRPDGSPCKGKMAARALAALIHNLDQLGVYTDDGFARLDPDLIADARAALAPFDMAKLLAPLVTT